MNVIIIEDDKDFSKKLHTDLQVFFGENKCDTVISNVSENFDNAISNLEFDIAFLDIDLILCNGIDLAHKIAKKNTKCLVIFVSSRKDLVFQSLTVQPFYFVRKQSYQDDLRMLFVLLRKHLNRNMIPAFTLRKTKKQIPLHTICYVESKLHNLFIYTEKEVLTESYTLQDFINYSNEFGFVQVHRSYIVNMAMVDRISVGQVMLFNGISIPVGRKYKVNFLEAYERYLLL
ncbi:LytR/AlgR family response regulator transcription factor [Tannockella kyphosi]|uniref:LytR/AlgR family response regulator transcription factor n=1 Tax=Tannockella kyphosi TaxID=2899121 RepID=UPI0020120DC6|nr:LytTR family DNA-binding domain-containing protein [Tannockella kyphosi]